MKRIVSGNQALAYGALAAGVDLAAGYPGTPSTEALSEIMRFARENGAGPWVEWSVNEKVAFDVATGAAWSGKRALATMKMSGLNVSLDSVVSVAYSGTTGGFVLYVADDPGAEAGMPEQDSRLFAALSGLPMLEPGTVRETFDLTRKAFTLSELIKSPVIVRLVTSVSHAEAELEADFSYHARTTAPAPVRDIARFTKAGSKLCVDQHRLLNERLAACEAAFAESGWNRADFKPGSRLCVVSSGVLNEYADEALAERRDVSTIRMTATWPVDRRLIRKAMESHRVILVLEELEPVLETAIRNAAQLAGWDGRIVGKMDGILPLTGRYSLREIEEGLRAAEDPPAPETHRDPENRNEGKPAETGTPAEPPQYRHPITFCSGCPHRGTYMALNRGIKAAGYARKDVVVTGDIGCTILGMNPPFDSCWTEVSMGSSIGLAQGFRRSGLETPVVAAIGDSTFFHAGIPPLVNAVQQGADILVIVLDNGWTSMTGFQANPGTDASLQPGRRVDMDTVIRAVGVDHFAVIEPFDQTGSVKAIAEALKMRGVRVLVSREECALTRERREPGALAYTVDPSVCVFCKACMRESGCTALAPAREGEKEFMSIDADLCRACGLCRTCCKFGAISQRGI